MFIEVAKIVKVPFGIIQFRVVYSWRKLVPCERLWVKGERVRYIVVK